MTCFRSSKYGIWKHAHITQGHMSLIAGQSSRAFSVNLCRNKQLIHAAYTHSFDLRPRFWASLGIRKGGRLMHYLQRYVNFMASLVFPYLRELSSVQEVEDVAEEDAMERAVSGGGYESDNDDTDAAVQMRPQGSGQPAAAIIALAAAPDG